ncbi:hypothetical protein LEP1GSC168_1150 [Leptospira santarosai str. HAI134]|nr:hypothetical protein LEP1GSC168_1150 [Leptospira santarosai str. HAI134]
MRNHYNLGNIFTFYSQSSSQHNYFCFQRNLYNYLCYIFLSFSNCKESKDDRFPFLLLGLATHLDRSQST